MTTNRRRGSRRSRRPRKLVEWITLTIGPVTVAINTQSVTDLLNGSLWRGSASAESTSLRPISRKGWTLIRTILDLRVNSTDAALSADFVVAMMGPINEDAYDASNYPDPAEIDDTGFPWILWKAGSALPASGVDLNHHFDVKSRRRLREPEDDLTLMIENLDAAQQLEYYVGIRCLLQAP